jgi:hypothetical protein
MSRQTIGLADLKSVGIPFAPHVVKAMMNAAHGFPLPVNGAHASHPVWNRATLTEWAAKHLTPRASARDFRRTARKAA